MEQHAPPLHPLARPRDLGEVAGNLDRRTGLRVADDRREPLQGSSACGRGAGRKPGHEPHKRGLNTKIHLAVDAHGMPVRVVITEGTRADCKEAVALIDGLSAEALLADRGYDTDEIVEMAVKAAMEPVIPPKKNRKVQRAYDRYVYKLRHLVENAFLHLKRWRGVATRYAKRSSSFLAAVQIRCMSLWAKII